LAAFSAVAHAQCASGSGVAFCSPTNGSTTATNVPISISGANYIVAMKLYVDGHDPAAYTVQSSTMATTLNLPAGSHNLTVVGWDNPGNVYQSSVTINASAATLPPASTPTSGSCPATGTGVRVCTPSNGGSTTSPVQITAGAAAGAGIAAMKVYIDDQDSYTIQSNSINTALPMSAGGHNVVVQAWDNYGNVYKTPVNVTVSGSAGCGTTSGVVFCSPTNGASTSGSVPVVAAGSSIITAMKLYVDGQDPAAFSTNSNNLNTTLNLSPGTHNLVVNAWDSPGNVYQQSINITVGGAAAPPAPPVSSGGSIPAPPANATVISNIQNQSGWQTCGGCGNEGGAGTGPQYNIAQGIYSPSLSGSSADFYVSSGPVYSGAYYFIEQPTVPNPVTYLKYEFDLYIPSQYVNAPQALEWECQENANGYTYNFAWQVDYASGDIRLFNYTTKNWEDTGIPFQRFSGNTWHHIITLSHASGTQTVHDSITIDGVTKPVNITHQALYTGNGPELTNAFQLDLDQNGTPYQVYLDNMKVTLAD
jgi:hypothetical protein